MNIDLNVLDRLEKLTYALRTVYMGKGYARYRLGKFEEYDFYSRTRISSSRTTSSPSWTPMGSSWL